MNVFRPIGMILLCVLCSITYAKTPEEKGLDIAKEADKRDTGFNDASANMLMILRNAHGQESKRKLRVKTLEGQQEGDKSLIIFGSPPDVKGTALLSYTYKTKHDDQWLYLPALKRVKRISASNQSGPFMGSEFAYEDFSSQEVEKYSYKYIKNETFNGKECFVLERYPKNKNSGYTKERVWMDTDEYRVWKVDFYDRKNTILKTLIMQDYKQYLNKYWRPLTMSMKNHQTNKSTVLKWDDYQFRVGLNDSDFTKTSLKRSH